MLIYEQPGNEHPADYDRVAALALMDTQVQNEGVPVLGAGDAYRGAGLGCGRSEAFGGLSKKQQADNGQFVPDWSLLLCSGLLRVQSPGDCQAIPCEPSSVSCRRRCTKLYSFLLDISWCTLYLEIVLYISTSVGYTSMYTSSIKTYLFLTLAVEALPVREVYVIGESVTSN